MENIIYCLQNISGLDNVVFTDEYPENIKVEHQADLVLTLLAGHLPSSVFQAVARKLGIDNNKMAIDCDRAFNRVLFK